MKILTKLILFLIIGNIVTTLCDGNQYLTFEAMFEKVKESGKKK